MRLLNSTNIELEEFPDDRIPKYTILSHRWQDGEVSLQDMQSATAIKKTGYIKLKLCCNQAAKDDLQYVWVDTCCIDKTSSAELSESINSMYRWYQNAVVCYAYLIDVESTGVPNDSSFSKSVWFTRGWTLQELIAPLNMEFYDSAWCKLGTKECLMDTIAVTTGIDVEALKGVDPEHFSVAKRMSWASKRTTTRAEDITYSLLGIFGVNMPMLYGEGDRAFIRLQEEIMKHSDDHSIFAWSSADDKYRGLLAKSPLDFRNCYNIVSSNSRLNRLPYSVTNMGLSIELPMIAWAMDIYFAALDCEVEKVSDSRVGMFLKLLPEKHQYARVPQDGTDSRVFGSELIPQSQHRQIYVRQKVWDSIPPLDRLYGFWIRKLPLKFIANGLENQVSEVTSWNEWNNEDRILKLPTGSCGTAGVLWYRKNFVHLNSYFVLKLGFDIEFNPVALFKGLRGGYKSQHFPTEPYDIKMDRGWIDQGNDNGIFRGDRLTGLNAKQYCIRILITKEVVEDQRMWVVDIENVE
ncbi:hypothetical protein G7Y89_g9309 [Cudoniella acicularis]|uniref:Heterokaryon incompatibility domain-containing protein n=1 Tax=Cudoniella acicularis TaxID=354080 RepID=A0A8H4VZR6_9HELO|nr:hypothetical protein G7Y89_g9309 [Cudoniella acicularis]